MIINDLDKLDIDKLNKDLLDGVENYIDVSKSEIDKLSKEERLSVLNRGLSVMTGFSN